MADYFDKDKFTGGANQSNDTGGGQEMNIGWGINVEPDAGQEPNAAQGPNAASRGTRPGQQQPNTNWNPPPGQGPVRPPSPPPGRPQKESNAWWYSWPAIIILFSLGIWPVALILLLYNLFSDKKKNTRQQQQAQNIESVVERVMRKAEERADSAADKTGEAFHRAAAQVEQSVSRAARQPEQAGQSKPARPAKKEKDKGKASGTLLRTLGIIFLVVGAMSGLDFMSEVFSYSADWEDFFTSIGFLLAGGLSFSRGAYLNRMSRRSQRYILAIGNTDAMPIDTIAKRVNRKPAKAMKELQRLIDKGYMGEDAYIDYERGYFLRFGATLEEEPEQEQSFDAPPAPEEAEEGYSGVLRSIRRANDRIADPELSRKIDRLERVAGLIFREVEEHPEKRERIRTFFDYYLPTTQKLLDAYADFEETGVEGEHLREAKARIEQTMDAIVDGFEHQLDQLYSTDAMDVVCDVKVMEAMLNRDLTTAAKDFGIETLGDEEKEEEGPRLQL